ncbi:nucleotidyltransferase family protein [Kordiimonas marina]|uniref:nucleotidyltransferase family protein n=1 Tax=Kordiimonas marina TaxID=2872312 RepID=UPI001FF5D3A9|nr:nucleotidyltransferase family protein [Kordiimonas marina]MCJ9430202.1 nucleotidyltransferase family protein [Kordiimonas marina]
MTGSVQVIMLAAGRSRRAGSVNKLLATLDGRPVICHAAEAALEGTGTPPLIVTGHENEKVQTALNRCHVSFLHNAAYADGMATSLVAGIEALHDDTSLFFVSLGDMPFVTPDTYRRLLTAAENAPDIDIFIPVHEGVRGHPILWRRTQAPALLGIEGDRGGRAIIRDNPALVSEVPVMDPGILIDLDTPEAMARHGITAEAP